MRSLAGRTIVVTRPADQSVELARALERRGARVIEAPAIRLVPSRSAELTRALRELRDGEFAWITLTSRSTVEMLASPGVCALSVCISHGTQPMPPSKKANLRVGKRSKTPLKINREALTI